MWYDNLNDKEVFNTSHRIVLTHTNRDRKLLQVPLFTAWLRCCAPILAALHMIIGLQAPKHPGA